MCDCGNLSSVYISLLRSRGIPSRHVVIIRPQNSNGPHVYAEFYLEKYGWIPVDVSGHLVNPGVDYFGIMPISNSGVIVTNGIDLTIDNGVSGSSMIPLLQQYAFWYQGSSSPSLTLKLSSSSKLRM